MKNGPDTNGISLRMEALWLDAENRIIQDIVRRIHQNSKITSTADYQINRLHELGRSTEEIEKILKDSLNATYPEMYKLYDDVANWQYVRNKDLYEQVNVEFIPPEENEWLIQLSEAVKKQTKDELENLAKSYGFAIMMGNKRVFTPFAQYYQQYVDNAIMDIISGGYDYNTVIRRVVSQMTNSGLRSVDYASGWSNRTPVAVRRAVMTGVSQITQQVNQRNAEILGTDYYEVSWHSSARPEHRVWQGKVYSYKDLVSICGLGSVTGLCGANCYHDYYPFIPGVSERLYSDKWLEEQNIKESYTKTWQGKEYDAYERTQKQRQMETAMRAQREKVDALKVAKVDPDEIMIARAKYQAQLNEYSQFCRKMGLKEQRERIYYDMRGRVATNTKKQNAKYTSEMMRNADKDSKLYGKYKLVLGKDVGSLADFRQLKYTDSERWKYVQLDYQRRNELLKHPELKLPNAKNALLPEAKFTKYLFDGEHPKGLAKGKAISSRLGYDIGNWNKFRDEIKSGVNKYPVLEKELTQHGRRYEQKMILQGLNKKPANVVVGWIQRPNGEVSMTSAYIKEVK